MWCVLVIEGSTHNRWNHTSHNGDVGNNIDILNIWNCLHFEDTNRSRSTAYIELRFSFTAGLVVNMSIHWSHGLWFHVCIRSSWVNCAFVSILLTKVCCCDELLAVSVFLGSPFVWSRSDKVSCRAILCGRTEWGAAAASKMAPAHLLFLSQESIHPPVDDASHT